MSAPRRDRSGRGTPRTRLRSLLVAVLVAAAGTVALTVSAAPAQAVQTDEFGLRPAGDAPRAKLEFPASGATVKDAVVVYNRTNHPITVNLQLVGVESPKEGQYSIGDRASATSDRITLPATTLQLPANQQANVPISLATPRGTTVAQWAAITATSADVNEGALAVRQRLAVLVGFTPTTALVPIADHGVGWWWLLIVLLVIAVAGGIWYWRRRRRQAAEKRSRRGGRHGAPSGRRTRRPAPVPTT